MARGSVNKVILIGNLGADPELRHTSSGVPVATFSLATNWTRRGEGGATEDNTEWHNVVTWRRLAEICDQYLRKGSKVYIEGRIQTRSWDDANTGQKRYKTEIVASEMQMLDSRGSGSAETFGGPEPRSVDEQVSDAPEASFPDTDDSDDDLPF